jgi:hypothetical protein
VWRTAPEETERGAAKRGVRKQEDSLSGIRLAARLALAVSLLAPVQPAIGADVETTLALLRLEGRYVKWGEPSYGSRARLTYAYLNEARTFDGAINCGDMLPMGAVLRSSRLSRKSFEHEVQAAFDTWSRVATVDFVRVDDPDKADIVLGAQRGARGVAFTNVFQKSAPTGGIDGIKKATICFDPAERWELGIDGDSKTYNVRYVAAHEIGHALGLDHRGRFGSVMGFGYRELPGQMVAVKLAPDDIGAIVHLYGAREARTAAGGSLMPRPVKFEGTGACQTASGTSVGEPVIACGLGSEGD